MTHVIGDMLVIVACPLVIGAAQVASLAPVSRIRLEDPGVRALKGLAEGMRVFAGGTLNV